jgi:hypothetical protein
VSGQSGQASERDNFALCPCETGLHFRGAPPLLPSSSCLSGQGVSLSFDRKRGGLISRTPRSPSLTPLDFFILEFVEDIFCRGKVQN